MILTKSRNLYSSFLYVPSENCDYYIFGAQYYLSQRDLREVSLYYTPHPASSLPFDTDRIYLDPSTTFILKHNDSLHLIYGEY